MKYNNIRKEDLRPWLQERVWLLPILGTIMIVLSPFLLPLVAIFKNRHGLIEVAVAYYKECVSAFKRVT